ncbi:uncharacterized protein [Rutidosis leptorrhynchoides]|uniref:uncharacterized protein n=1 Tax=Rutidosis leptorrhynchoides TaxID=125765 RepID=UPI003A996CDD
MAEVQPPVDGQVNGSVATGAPATVLAETVVGPTKRQRRPSVRLGEIGDHQHTYDNNNHNKRIKQNWKFNKFSAKTPKSQQTLDTQLKNNNNNGIAFGGWKVNDSKCLLRRGFSSKKQIKSNWVSEDDDDYDDADRYSDQSLNLSMDYGVKNRDGNNGISVRVSDGDKSKSDTDGINWNNGGLERNGVRVWLNQIGLGRYYSIFEVHEVDDEVLPLLTLEDLKDMGINAVGSRRKMFCSIQKLGKGFS